MNNASAEGIGDVKDVVTVRIVSRDFEKSNASCNGFIRVENINGDNDRGIKKMSPDLFGAVKVGVKSDSNARDSGVVSGADGERIDIEITSREERGDTD